MKPEGMFMLDRIKQSFMTHPGSLIKLLSESIIKRYDGDLDAITNDILNDKPWASRQQDVILTREFLRDLCLEYLRR
ncbi:MAG: hypothetical protein RDV48_04560 [Candidatus Eremiobacteraeota bacterium]|nr:hypothetical protein [Candidatus Eremiobacteraeota bacterium]